MAISGNWSLYLFLSLSLCLFVSQSIYAYVCTRMYINHIWPWYQLPIGCFEYEVHSSVPIFVHTLWKPTTSGSMCTQNVEVRTWYHSVILSTNVPIHRWWIKTCISIAWPWSAIEKCKWALYENVVLWWRHLIETFKRLSKQPRGWWFEAPSCPFWRHCNVRDISPHGSVVITSWHGWLSITPPFIRRIHSSLVDSHKK